MSWVLHTFNDLIFKADEITKIRIATIEEFVNGYGVRVEETVDGYNMVVLKDKLVCNKTHMTPDQMKELTKDEVTYYMRLIQRLGRHKYGDELETHIKISRTVAKWFCFIISCNVALSRKVGITFMGKYSYISICWSIGLL